MRSFKAAQRVQEFSGQAAKPFDWRGVILKAVSSAASAFVTSLIDAVRESVFKKIDAFAGEALGLQPNHIESIIKRYLLKEVTNLFTTEAIDRLNRAVATAVSASLDSAGNFDELKFGKHLVSALSDELTSLLKGKVTAIPESVGDQIAELVTG